MCQYDVYYDESKEDGYWHGILFVPVDKKSILTSLLEEARRDYPFIYRLHFVNISANEPLNSLRTKLTESYISIGLAALQQQKFHKKPQAKVGRNPKIIEPIGVKFAVYRVLGMDELNKIAREDIISRTLKSAIKGAVHYLFDGSKDIEINRIFFEGGSACGISDENIMDLLKNEVRGYVKNLPDGFIFQSSDHNKIDEEKNADDSHLLQLCDSLVGAVRFSVIFNNLFEQDNDSRILVSRPIYKILEYSNQSYPRMKESRYFRGFSLSEAKIENGEWTFKNLNSPNQKKSTQIQLL